MSGMKMKNLFLLQVISSRIKCNGVGVVKTGYDWNASIAISYLIFNLFCWESQVNFKHESILNQEEGISIWIRRWEEVNSHEIGGREEELT